MRPVIVVVQEGSIVAGKFSPLIMHSAVPDRVCRNVGLHSMIGPVGGLSGVWAELHEFAHQPSIRIDDEISDGP